MICGSKHAAALVDDRCRAGTKNIIKIKYFILQKHGSGNQIPAVYNSPQFKQIFSKNNIKIK
jgi:hypothetical protein